MCLCALQPFHLRMETYLTSEMSCLEYKMMYKAQKASICNGTSEETLKTSVVPVA